MSAALANPSASANDELGIAAREEAALRDAAESVADSVVQIRTIGGLDSASGSLLPDGPTSGLIISADGYILSSSFNFLQQPTSILVTLPKGRRAPAELVATDHSRMLVLLKVAGASDLPVPPLAPPEEIRPGQWAVAVGRTFRPERVNVSVGIVSAVNRMFGKAIQTDAAVSTANYGGPLVDIRGRVLGLIVPMAGQGGDEVAGAEWYDSGIGFAVPIPPLANRLELMKKGDDQRSGLLGIGLEAKNPHSSPPKIAAVRPDSPAGQAGLQKGDIVVEIDGRPIRTQTEMRFALGPRYGGETVKLVAKRGEERLERSITLAGELPPFRHAFLGILPIRPAEPQEEAKKNAGEEEADDDQGDAEQEKADNDSPAGVLVRMVYHDSPAADAGVKVGDCITSINGSEVKSIDDAQQALNNLAPGSELKLEVVRGNNTLDLAAKAARLPTTVPAEVPPAQPPVALAQGEPAKPGESTDLKLAEFPHACQVYVPSSATAKGPSAVLIWLQPAEEANAEQTINQWQTICDRDGVLLVVPTPAEKKRWERTDLEYLQRLLERIVAQYTIDRHRIAVYGEGSAGALAWPLGLANRDAVRGIAVSAAPLPRQIRVPPNEPAQRLAVFSVVPTAKDSAAQVAEGLEKLTQAGYPVTISTAREASGKLTDSQRAELARWLDTLDRF